RHFGGANRQVEKLRRILPQVAAREADCGDKRADNRSDSCWKFRRTPLGTQGDTASAPFFLHANFQAFRKLTVCVTMAGDQKFMPTILNNVEVRVLGSLVEKQVTTPEYYPLTLNSLTLACNQKNNRHPVTSLSEATVAEAVESLREKNLIYVF